MSERKAVAKKILAIESVRGIAACFVVLFHALHQIQRYNHRFDVPGLAQGWEHHWLIDMIHASVDAFFMVSGFVIVLTNWGSKARTPVRFMFTRIARVMPLYWVLTAGYALLLVGLPHLFHADRFEGMHFLRSMALIPSQGPNGVWAPVISVGWTLVYEIVFYYIFALALFVKNDRNRIVLASILMAPLVFFHLFISEKSNPILYHISGPIVLDFIVGIWLGYIYCQRKKLGHWFFILPIFVPALVMQNVESHLSIFRLTLPATLFFLGIFGLESKLQGRKTRFILERLGAATYAIYLVQVFTLPAIAILITKTVGWTTFGIAGNAILMIIGTVVAGHLVHTQLEQRINRLITPFIRRRPKEKAVLPSHS